MAMDLCNLNCAFVFNLPSTGHFFIKPKNNSSKLCAIFDGRYANSLYPHPPKHYSLPSFLYVKNLNFDNKKERERVDRKEKKRVFLG